jgi:hypothetical protein
VVVTSSFFCLKVQQPHISLLHPTPPWSLCCLHTPFAKSLAVHPFSSTAPAGLQTALLSYSDVVHPLPLLPLLPPPTKHSLHLPSQHSPCSCPLMKFPALSQVAATEAVESPPHAPITQQDLLRLRSGPAPPSWSGATGHCHPSAQPDVA